MNQSATWEPDTFIQLTEYREVEEILRRGRDFVLEGTKAESDEFVHGTLVAIDGREHLTRRRAVMKMINPRQPWGPEGRLVDEVFADTVRYVESRAEPRDGLHRFDLIEFGRRVVWRVTAALVGIDGIDDHEQIDRFLQLARPVLEGLTIEYLPQEKRPAMLVAAREARSRIREEMFEPSLARRRALLADPDVDVDELPADLLTSLLSSGDGRHDDDMIFREAIALLAASVNNPVSQLAWSVDEVLRWLAEHPEDRERLGEREFLNKVVKESLRLHRSSRPHLVRIAVQDTVLESTGRRIPAGSWVSGWLEQADHDRTVFGPDADVFDPYRTVDDPKVAHFGLAFGAGPHVCLGRPMLLWEQGEEQHQGIQTKVLRLLLERGVDVDPDGVRRLGGLEGGRRYERYDVVFPAATSHEVNPSHH